MNKNKQLSRLHVYTYTLCWDWKKEDTGKTGTTTIIEVHSFITPDTGLLKIYSEAITKTQSPSRFAPVLLI
jgi:hypothetical protein